VTPNNRHKIELFVRAQNLLHVDENGLTDDTSFDDVQAVAQVCPQIRELTRGLNTREEYAINRLATLTEAVCMTWGQPNRQAVKEWQIARCELLQLRIPRV
jgi:hypothetical protein